MKDPADKSTVELFADNLCPVCSSLLPSSKTKRFSFCSNSCKQSDYRQRKKALRIASSSSKALRIHKKPKEISATYEGVSGTVHRLDPNTPTPSVRVIPSNPAPTIRTIDGLAALFSGF